MKIADLRHATGLSQREFSAKYGIPLGTLRNWEQGIAKPPKYVSDMLHRLVIGDIPEKLPLKGILDDDVVDLLGQLSSLTRLSQYGCKPIAAAADENAGAAIYYDEDTEAVSEGSYGAYSVFRVAKSFDIVNSAVHVTAYWDTDKPYTVRLIRTEKGTRIEVMLSPADGDRSPLVLIKDGQWRVYNRQTGK